MKTKTRTFLVIAALFKSFQDLLMVINHLQPPDRWITMNEIQTENFIAEQRATGVESL